VTGCMLRPSFLSFFPPWSGFFSKPGPLLSGLSLLTQLLTIVDQLLISVYSLPLLLVSGFSDCGSFLNISRFFADCRDELSDKVMNGRPTLARPPVHALRVAQIVMDFQVPRENSTRDNDDHP